MENRITELEIKFSFAQDLLETLNLTVYRQQQSIERLATEVRALREQVSGMTPITLAQSAGDEIPPHY
ncbi:MAG: SlyX family protein [Zoogloeaceae bacterium]|jgi:SlyX protein|nr:SlyX family protein [Zoogloeaceae bacterium]